MGKIKLDGLLWATYYKPFRFRFVGARSWFPSSLICSQDILEINELGSIEKYIFTRGDIISIDLYKGLFIQYGIRINHKVKEYSEYICFHSFSENDEEIIKKIKSTGFLDKDISLVDEKIIKRVKMLQKKFSTVDVINNIFYIILLIICIPIIGLIIYLVVTKFI